MAEGWVRHLAPAVAVESADTQPAGLSRHAVAVMAEAGADISVQCSKLLSATAWRDADIAVTLCGSAREECVALPVASDAARALADSGPGSGASGRRLAGAVPHSARRDSGAGGGVARHCRK